MRKDLSLGGLASFGIASRPRIDGRGLSAAGFSNSKITSAADPLGPAQIARYPLRERLSQGGNVERDGYGEKGERIRSAAANQERRERGCGYDAGDQRGVAPRRLCCRHPSSSYHPGDHPRPRLRTVCRARRSSWRRSGRLVQCGKGVACRAKPLSCRLCDAPLAGASPRRACRRAALGYSLAPSPG
jgi:hypothetical protein